MGGSRARVRGGRPLPRYAGSSYTVSHERGAHEICSAAAATLNLDNVSAGATFGHAGPAFTLVRALGDRTDPIAAMKQSVEALRTAALPSPMPEDYFEGIDKVSKLLHDMLEPDPEQ